MRLIYLQLNEGATILLPKSEQAFVVGIGLLKASGMVKQLPVMVAQV